MGDSKAMRDLCQTECLQDFYQLKLSYGDEALTNKLGSLERNPDFAHVFDDIKKGGVKAAMSHYYNEALMLKLSRAMGGVDDEVKDKLASISKNPVTIHEACKMGDIKVLEDFLSQPGEWDIDEKDAKGISCLGYAIGANRPQIVKKLTDEK